MLDSNVKSNKFLKTILIKILISAGSGSVVGAFLCFRIPKYWDLNRIARLGIFLASGFLLGIIFFYLLKIAKYIFKRNNIEVKKITLFIPILISFAFGLFVLLGSRSHIPDFWLNGWGIKFESVLNIIVVLIILPFYLYLVLNSIMLLRKVKDSGKIVSQGKPVYQKFFCIILLVLIMTPMILTVPQFEEFNSKFWGK